MKDYMVKDIRNIAVLGHGSEGKTTLVESMLFAAGVTDRQGRVEDGNTVSDYDPEEIKRHISISAAVAPIEIHGKKLNLIDVPGRNVRPAARRGGSGNRHQCRNWHLHRL